jgi:putative intracellular protease/amidase
VGKIAAMKIACLIFDKFTALDVVGPYEVLSRLPGAELSFVAKETGPKRSDTGVLGLTADRTLAELPDPDLLLVGGGEGNRRMLDDPEILDWLRTANQGTTLTTSVCTGALVLGAAGLLEGKRATTHWAYLDKLCEYGAEPVAERYVVDGRPRHGPRPGRPDRRRGRRQGHPARDRVRPGATVRLGSAAQGHAGARRADPPVRGRRRAGGDELGVTA